MRLGEGGYIPPRGESRGRLEARRFFLAALNESVPEFRQLLIENVLPVHRPEHRKEWEDFLSGSPEETLRRFMDDPASLTVGVRCGQLVGLMLWIRNLLGTWIEDVVWASLDQWSSHDDGREWHFPTPKPDRLGSSYFVHVSEAWAHSEETWGEYSKRARAGFNAQLKNFKAGVKEDLLDHGWVSSELRPGGEDLPDIFRWLVHERVEGRSITDIARAYDVGREAGGAYDHTGRAAVRRGIDRAAAMVGLYVYNGPEPEP